MPLGTLSICRPFTGFWRRTPRIDEKVATVVGVLVSCCLYWHSSTEVVLLDIEALSQAIGNTVVLPHLSGALPLGSLPLPFRPLHMQLMSRKMAKVKRVLAIFSFIFFFLSGCRSNYAPKELLPQLNTSDATGNGEKGFIDH